MQERGSVGMWARGSVVAVTYIGGCKGVCAYGML